LFTLISSTAASGDRARLARAAAGFDPAGYERC
jgi:hypothetical protein